MCICQIYDLPYYYRDYLCKTDLNEFRNIEISNGRERDVDISNRNNN
ncbi:hypothetical protein Gohar_000735, partial [Gossypium harknessii]|nr:hypothetical protein [Gossypium harknessii]